MKSMGNSSTTEEPRAQGRLAGWVYIGFAGFYLLLNCIVAWLGYWLMSGQWPGRPKLLLCTVLGGIGVGLLLTLISRVSRGSREGSEHRTVFVIPPIHALGILLLLAAESVFITWLVWGPG